MYVYEAAMASVRTCMHSLVPRLQLPYSLKFSRIKYFVVWLSSAQKQIFADKIFVVERESVKCIRTYTTSIKFFAG